MKDSIVGIDIGSSATRVVVASSAAPGQPPAVHGCGDSETEGLRRGYIADAEKVEKSIRYAVVRAEKKSGFKIKKAYVAIGGQSLTSDTIDVSIIVSKGDGQVTEFDLDALEEKSEQTFISHKKNKKILHVIPIRFALDGEDVMGNPIGMYGSKIKARYLIISTLEHHFIDLIHTINDAGIDVLDVVAAPLSTSIAVLSSKQRTVGVGLLDIGSQTTTLSIFENDRVLGIATFPIGSLDITNDIALGLKISLEEAKDVKENYQNKSFSYSKRKVNDIISARLSDVFEMTNKYLSVHNRRSLLPAGVVIVGGGAMIHGIENQAESQLQLPISVTHPSKRFGRAVKLLPDKRWLVAYSLCFLDSGARANFSNNVVKKILKSLKTTFNNVIEQFMP